MNNLPLTYISLAPLSSSDHLCGPFRVLDGNGMIFEEFGLTETEATDLAYWLHGSIQHYDMDRQEWCNW